MARPTVRNGTGARNPPLNYRPRSVCRRTIRTRSIRPTVIKYRLPSPVSVEVVVYNLLGEKVATLVDEVQAAGYYTIRMERPQQPEHCSAYRHVHLYHEGRRLFRQEMMLVK